MKADKLKGWERGWDKKSIGQKILGKWALVGMNCNYLGECRDWSDDEADFLRFFPNGNCIDFRADSAKQTLRYVLKKNRAGLDLIIVKAYFNDGRNLPISVILIKPDSMILEFPDENNNSGVFVYNRVE